MSQADTPATRRLLKTGRMPPPLFLQQDWFIRLRWVAGAAVVAGALLDWHYLHWYRHGPQMVVVGVGILAYNLVLWGLMRAWQRAAGGRRWLLALAWSQILLDLVFHG